MRVEGDAGAPLLPHRDESSSAYQRNTQRGEGEWERAAAGEEVMRSKSKKGKTNKRQIKEKDK